jgi:broad specificity phosphatase PhoE
LANTVIHLLRHGEVENPQKVIYERLPDFHLSLRGQKMAEQVGRYIKGHQELSQITHIISSPLDRTVETASPVAKALNLELHTDERLLESEHRLAGINPRKAPLKALSLSFNPFRPSWGEPYLQIAKRMESVISDVLKEYQEQQVLLVSHQSPIWLARLFFEGRPLYHNPAKRVCELASITSLVFNNSVSKLEKVIYRIPARNL